MFLGIRLNIKKIEFLSLDFYAIRDIKDFQLIWYLFVNPTCSFSLFTDVSNT